MRLRLLHGEEEKALLSLCLDAGFDLDSAGRSQLMWFY